MKGLSMKKFAVMVLATWRSIHRPLLVGSTLTALLSLGAVVPAASAANAAGCYAISCAGWDPVARGCSVTSTTAYNGPLGTVWNRYSAGCKSNWSRGQLSAASVSAGYQMIVSITTVDSSGAREWACWPAVAGQNNAGVRSESCSNTWYGGSSVGYSDMVDGTNITSAFIEITDAYGDPLAGYEADQ
jgi:hypothetical protein